MSELQDNNEQLREAVFNGKTIKQNLRDIVSSSNTGYPYDELVNILKKPENDEQLEIDELDEVDKTVNLLVHLLGYSVKNEKRKLLESIQAELPKPTHEDTFHDDSYARQEGRNDAIAEFNQLLNTRKEQL